MNKKVTVPTIAPLIRKLLRETPPPKIISRYKEDKEKAKLMNLLLKHQWGNITQKELDLFRYIVGASNEAYE